MHLFIHKDNPVYDLSRAQVLFFLVFITGLLGKVETFYNIHDESAGLLQAIFIVGYMCFSPVFGYLGDRYNRKYLMCAGIFFWSGVTLASSFVPNNVSI